MTRIVWYDGGMTLELEWFDLAKLGLAVVVGGAVGFEREFRDKAAGFRTMIFICVGAALFTMFSIKMAGDRHDATRIASNIVTGIGFLGAGAILRYGPRVLGLTTAASIWIVAALGMGIGAGYFLLSLVAALVTLAVLWFFPAIESRIDAVQETRTYRVTCSPVRENFLRLEGAFRESGLRVRTHKHMKEADRMICVWTAVGSPEHHDRIMEILFADDEVKEFDV